LGSPQNFVAFVLECGSQSRALGQGARLALAGAASLAAALGRHAVVDDALTEYDRCQRTLATRYQRWSRWLTPLFQSNRHGALWLRDRMLPPLSRRATIERGCSECSAGRSLSADVPVE